MVNKKILIIDDDDGINEVLEIALSDKGYQTKIKTEIDKLIDDIEQFMPDLILLDVFLPNCNGSEICNQIKGNIKFQKIPIIIFSASAQTEKLAGESGADDFLYKPFELDELLKKIQFNLLR